MKFITVRLKAVAVEHDLATQGASFGLKTAVEVPVRMYVDDGTTLDEAAMLLGELLERKLDTIDLGDED